MIVAFLAVMFFAGLIYVQGIIKNVFDDVGSQNEVNAGQPMYVNMSLASEQIWGPVNQSIQALRLVALVYILGLATILIVTNIFVRTNPIFFFVYILISLLAILFAPTISNAYETLLNSNVFEGTLATFGTVNFIMLNLPMVVLVITLIGGILSFINMMRGVTGEESI
jgi:hypothetical protein